MSSGRPVPANPPIDLWFGARPVLRYMNAVRRAADANARLGGGDVVHANGANRVMVPVYAARAINEHDEVTVAYGAGYGFGEGSSGRP